MTRHTTQHNDDAYDLGRIFIGREQQLDLFDIYLTRWQQLLFTADPDLDPPVMTPPSPNHKLQGLVVLLYGRGGFGKSTLLRHYRDIALQEGRHLTVSKIIDWEFAVEGKRGLFNPPPGQQVDPAEYFRVLCTQLAIALDKEPRVFKEYQAAVRAVDEARKKASSALDSMRQDTRYGWLGGLAVEAITTAIRTSVPGSGVILDNPAIKRATEGVAQLTQDQVAHLRERLRDRLGNTLDDYLDPALRLGLALGRDLHDLARNYPLLLCFDTYEEIDEADRLLRIVMGAAGARAGWVLAGRDNLWAGPGQRERSTSIEYGYKDLVPADRGLSVNFNAGDVGAFTISDITEYFALLRKQVRPALSLPGVTAADAKGILDVTQGVPLAVKIAAGLYAETATLETITADVAGKREIVDGMVRRYLLHTRTEQSEKLKLYGLATLRRAEGPAAVAAALALTPEQAASSFASDLSQLHRRYSFIFTEKDQPTLHQEVRHFLRQWLLEHRKDPEIVAVNQRLHAAHEAALKQLEAHRQYATLQERLEEDEWAGVYLDLAEQQCWLDPVEGVRLLLPFMLAAAIYRRDSNEDAVAVGQFFATNLRSPYRSQWQWVTTSLIYNHSRDPSDEELTGLIELAKLARERCPSFPPPLPDARQELEAALWWRLGEAYLDKDDTQALAWYEQALERIQTQRALKEAAAEAAWNVSYTLNKEKKHTECLSYLNRAIELNPDYAIAFNSRGYVYNELKQYEQAITDLDRATVIDPNDDNAHLNRGKTYYHLKQYEQAIADFDRAVELDPNNAAAYTNRGAAYDELKQYERAIADYDRAIALDPNNAVAYTNRGYAYRNLRKYEQAIADYDRAIALDPNYALAYNNRGLAYLWLHNTRQAHADFSRGYELDPTDINAAWMAEWAVLGKQRAGSETAARLEQIAAIDPQSYVSSVCRGVALGLRGQLKAGLAALEQAISLDPEEWDAPFWRGMLSAYYHQARSQETITLAAIERSLQVGLPPVLLTPLYWLEHERPAFFVAHLKPLLAAHGL
jgi:tetratricopeptide (TPR) repeat protein